jgi:mutator protein MutT
MSKLLNYPITQLPYFSITQSKRMSAPSRSYPDRPIVGVGAVVIQDGKVLLVRRAAEPLRGEWSLPGGMLELGETLRQGVEREVLEETGLRVVAKEVLDAFDSIFPDAEGRAQFHYVLVDFLCELRGGDLRTGGDAAEALWASVDELERFGLSENAKRVILKAISDFH